MYDNKSQISDDETRQALLQALKDRIAQLMHATAQSNGEPGGPAEKNSAGFAGSAGSSLEPQSLPTGSVPGPAGSAADPSGSAAIPPGSSRPFTALQFAAELEKLDPELRQAASDLYEHLHFKSNFARLTVSERDAVLELLKYHPAEKVAEIVSRPPPIGLNLQTSKTGLNRFRDDYMRCAMQASKAEATRRHEEECLAADERFQKANASDETFRQTSERQIRKLLFTAINDSNADYHQIRWLLKSLEMLRRTETT